MRPIAVMAGAAAVAFGYLAAHALGLPMLWLDSALGTWSFGERPSSAAMDFFGRSLWALSLGLVFAVVASRVKATERRAQVAAVLCGLVMLAAFAVEARRLYSRVPVAEQFPSGYDPVTGRVVGRESPTRLAGP